MEALSETKWDVLISGTGVQQSLLALALSREGKKVLHVDRNEFYGGPDAAFSLQEAEEWVKTVPRAASSSSPFLDAELTTQQPVPATNTTGEAQAAGSEKLGASRAYSLALSPHLIYSRSRLLKVLVSSKVYRQLEFLAVGSWWVYTPPQSVGDTATSEAADAAAAPLASEGADGADTAKRNGELRKVPNGREDIFKDSSIDLKSKRALMKFLKFVVDYEQQPEVWEADSTTPFPEFLSSKFNMPKDLQTPLLALTLTPNPPNQTTTGYALPRIYRHLKSIGFFGPGFGAVIPKWGGGAEIAQIACRAQAVGGGVYVLGGGVEAISPRDEDGRYEVKLATGDTVKTKWIVGSTHDLPAQEAGSESTETVAAVKSISVVSSPLQSLFPDIAEGAPPPAGAVVVFPSGSLAGKGEQTSPDGGHPPVYIIVHSSETGECPVGQSVLYATVHAEREEGSCLLRRGIETLLWGTSTEHSPRPKILYEVSYVQASGRPTLPPAAADLEAGVAQSGNILAFPAPGLDLVFDDRAIERVEGVWRKIISGDGTEVGGEEEEEEFMVFEDREGADGMSDEE